MIRTLGWYWVRLVDGWAVAEWADGEWRYHGWYEPHGDEAVEEVGEFIGTGPQSGGLVADLLAALERIANRMAEAAFTVDGLFVLTEARAAIAKAGKGAS